MPQAETTLFLLRPSSQRGMLVHSEVLGESWPKLENSETVVLVFLESTPLLLTPLTGNLGAFSLCAEMDLCDCILLHLLLRILRQQTTPIPRTNPNANPATMPTTKCNMIEFIIFFLFFFCWVYKSKPTHQMTARWLCYCFLTFF